MSYFYEDDKDEESPEEGLYFKFIKSNSKNNEWNIPANINDFDTEYCHSWKEEFIYIYVCLHHEKFQFRTFKKNNIKINHECKMITWQ